MVNKSPGRLYDNSPKPQVKENDTLGPMNTYTDSESVDTQPNIVSETQSFSKDESLDSSDQQSISEDYEIDNLSNSGTMSSESLDRSNSISEDYEIDNLSNLGTMSSESLDRSNVNVVQSESPQSQKKDKVTKGSKYVDNSFILHTIQQYDKHLKTSNTFKGILTDESLDLLSTLTLESEDNIKLVSYLFCVDHCVPEGIANVALPIKYSKIIYAGSSLCERGLITFSPLDADEMSVTQCLDLLTTSSQIGQACKNIIKKKVHSAPKEVFTSKTDLPPETIKSEILKVYSNGTPEIKIELLNRLRSKVKAWKLSDLARETIIELSILMHLDNIFEMGCSIDFTQICMDRPVLKFKPSSCIKLYPVDKKMILDNATIIFQDRKEFCAYLNAKALYQKYKLVRVQDKHEFIFSIYNMYKNVNKEMSHYKALPLWLLRFTPLYIYVEILADGVKYFKEVKEYGNALKILDLLITEIAFKQDTKAEWYETKAFIQSTKCNFYEKAASTLCEAFKAGLPEETVMILQRRANLVLKKFRYLDQKVIDILKDNAVSVILEINIKTPQKSNNISSQKETINRGTRLVYKLENEPVTVEELCSILSENDSQKTVAKHWEGSLMAAIFFMLFWDIIYTKPLAIGGIFLSYYQKFPLDMLCESFYTNRKVRIDDLLIKIENSSKDDIKKMVENRFDEFVEFYLPNNTNKKVNHDNVMMVLDCLDGQRLAAICRRLVKNYEYMRDGFPDLTLCHTENCTIEFREVKRGNDTAKPNQLQWLHYLNKHDIAAGFHYINDNPQETANESKIDNSYSAKTNDEDVQPGPSLASIN